MANIVEIAISNGNFKTLVKAVTEAGLADILTGDGPFTVFAPNDEAFAKLPAGTIEALLKDKKKLTDILTYHVVEGKHLAKEVVKQPTLKTVLGKHVSIANGSGVKVDKATVIAPDIVADNGVIHVIDEVIIPQ